MDIFKLHFAKKLREALSISGLKQKDLAEKLHINDGAVSRWVSGKDFPREERLPDIANALGVSPDFFGPQSSHQSADGVIIREILSILAALDEPKLRRALELIKVVRDDTRNQVDAPKKRKDIR